MCDKTSPLLSHQLFSLTALKAQNNAKHHLTATSPSLSRHIYKIPELSRSAAFFPRILSRRLRKNSFNITHSRRDQRSRKSLLWHQPVQNKSPDGRILFPDCLKAYWRRSKHALTIISSDSLLLVVCFYVLWLTPSNVQEFFLLCILKVLHSLHSLLQQNSHGLRNKATNGCHPTSVSTVIPGPSSPVPSTVLRQERTRQLHYSLHSSESSP